MSAAFQLDERLAADSLPVCMCGPIELRLMNDARYWWVLLVPHHAGAEEWHHLPEAMAEQLMQQSLRVMGVVETLANADKMNVAALGNMVRQLHVHVIARHVSDAAWPGPIWGVGEATPYRDDAAHQRIAALQHALG